jgi:hypothetical protein
MLIFRDANVDRRGVEVVRELVAELGNETAVLGALLRAAELECALEDLGALGVTIARQVTDHVADAWAGADSMGRARARDLLARLPVPEVLPTKRPEGYAFYNVHPGRVAEALDDVPRAALGRVRIVGVRTVGTSLSACVRAVLARRGAEVERMTVRPTGHPWARQLELGPRELELVARGKGATFVVADEGPGLSGSTFLAVAEALAGAGVSPAAIHLLSTNPIAAEHLRARDAVVRFAPYPKLTARPWVPPPGCVELSAGAWRSRLNVRQDLWPESWMTHERVKYLEPDERWLHKFSGLSPYMGGVLERAELLAAVGFSPQVKTSTQGFLAYRWLTRGGAPAPGDRGAELERATSYLAFRARELSAPASSTSALEAMTTLNLAEACGIDLPSNFGLACVAPVIADGRLRRHEWVRASNGTLLKTDAAEHGDDHFFPGPVDTAWDLAGLVTEWQLDEAETAAVQERYGMLTGDDVSRRLNSYVLAYCAFRLGVVRFAREQGDEAEQRRFRACERIYRTRLRAALPPVERRAFWSRCEENA